MGRPISVRSSDLADILVEGLTDGVPLRKLCRDNGISKSTVYDWMDDDEAFNGRIARARERGYHEIADESLEIVDNLEEDPSSRRVRSDHRLKLLAKWSPRHYGDKVALVGGDETDKPISIVKRVIVDTRAADPE